jgi:carboxymethylenebutenolidase
MTSIGSLMTLAWRLLVRWWTPTGGFSYPGRDSVVSLESFLAMQNALQVRRNAPSIVHLFPEAEHGFSDRRRHNKHANAEAFQISWPQALAFIQETTRAV